MKAAVIVVLPKNTRMVAINADGNWLQVEVLDPIESKFRQGYRSYQSARVPFYTTSCRVL
jgi:hypothetical protein